MMPRARHWVASMATKEAAKRGARSSRGRAHVDADGSWESDDRCVVANGLLADRLTE